MLEGLVAWVLNNYLGKYVENLNTTQLSIALLSGEVEFENLPLKRDALRHLGLPFQIKAGFIGKIKLQIPVRQIRSAPWVIRIEQLYLVATPLPVREWDAEMEEMAAHDLKLSALDSLEARWRLEKDSKENNSTYYASSYSTWLSYGSGFMADIIENLQLKIDDVHIRYEDDISILDKAVAFGITIESISAQSCGENWQPGFTPCDTTASFKILEMQKLAVYWKDLNYKDLLADMDRFQLTTAMSSNNSFESCYILAPVSAQAKIKRNRSKQPLRNADTPRIICDLLLEDVPLLLVDWQYNQIVKCTKGLDDISRYRGYRKFRPPCPIKEDARAWWLYAISCHFPDRQPDICRTPPTWESCLQRAKDNVKYHQIYSKILLTPTTALAPEEKKLKDEVEWSRSYEELKVLRELAMHSLPIQTRISNEANATGRNTLVRWFPQWIGWYSSSTTSTESEGGLEGEILQALSDSIEDNTLLRRDAVFGRFTFTMNSGTLTLSSAQENSSIPMMELQFKNLCVNIVSRPRSSSHLVELSLGALYLRDKFTPNTLFPVLIGPPGQERVGKARGPSPRVSVTYKSEEIDYIFSMAYEKKPENINCDYRLCVTSKSLDVVYQPSAVRWLTEFLCLPHQKTITQSQIEAMKSRTKKELIKNWEQILDGRMTARKSWDLQLDITAPQIFFVEKFSDPNVSIAVIDFGCLHLRNNVENLDILTNSKKEEDEEMFMTPCSTPPASEESDSEQITQIDNNILTESLNEVSLHQKIYDRYSVELTDMQILIAKVRDNWRYAHKKGTSTFHVLDRFNISLQIERRVIHTYDPHYPSLTLNANLPKLVAHFNEQKIASARKLAQIITAAGIPSPFNVPETNFQDTNFNPTDEEDSISDDVSVELSRLLMLQFTIDHLAIEVQSRGRSVAELQVSGVKLGFTKRPGDINITLSVHSLLLVDALQTFGPDFELLVASHKHVGMDSMSGSLKDSEPTSPISPGSPDPNVVRTGSTSPIALSQALNSLSSSPPNSIRNLRGTVFLDAEALISLDLLLVFGTESLQIANIQFNNLDIIANQETIVELMGFIQRVFPSQKGSTLSSAPLVTSSPHSSVDSIIEESKMGTTEITFDFHRLNVLLLRGIVKDGCIYGKKICTATMSEAKIQATVNKDVIIEGSLGGLQVLDLTPEGHMHQRIVSVGHDPLVENTHPLYLMSTGFNIDDNKAFSFKIIRSLNQNSSGNNDHAEVTVRMASLWYTHSPHFVVELQSCATEFKQYLANLARSIRTAATDMALGLVHARTEALAQSLYMNSRISASIYGSALSFSEMTSPRRRRRSSSLEQSYSGYSSARDTIPQTPYSPEEDQDFQIDLKLDIVLESPVLVLPRASNSHQVFVAHLGNINVTNERPSDIHELQKHREHYLIEIREMNLFSLDTASRRVPGLLMSRSEILYACDSLAVPILHNTVVKLEIKREIPQKFSTRQSSLPNLLIDDETDGISGDSGSFNEYVEVTGTVVTALKISLTRAQYEQLLDTVQWFTSKPRIDNTHGPIKGVRTGLTDICEEDTGVTTLNMDPHVRAKLFPAVGIHTTNGVLENQVAFKVFFDLPIFTIEFRGDSPMGEQGLVDLSLRDFNFRYDKGHLYETNIHVSLRSIYMEDLLQPEGSKQRAMVISSSGEDIRTGLACLSNSCPNIYGYLHPSSPIHGSLPDYLGMGGGAFRQEQLSHGASTMTNSITSPDAFCPSTPPPSPSARPLPRKNLVLISTIIVDPKAPNFKTYYNSLQRSTTVDFNCLDLVINIESWVVVIDFFGASTSDVTDSTQTKTQKENLAKEQHFNKAETNITVQSLNIVLARPDGEVAKANISKVEVVIRTEGNRKEVDGHLGSISLLDLTRHGQLYRERFSTSGKEALKFNYVRHGPEEVKDFDSQLTLNMSSVIYVHTKRFVVEIQSFFNHFTQLQAIMAGIRAATSGKKLSDEISRFSIILEAESPVIFLPVSSKSPRLIMVDLGQLKVTNCFKYSGDEGTVSVLSNTSTDRKCLLDVMYLKLHNVNLQAVERESGDEKERKGEYYKYGNYSIRKCGKSILTEKCHLAIQVERNLHSSVCHNVPDMSIHGELSTLDGTLNISQYKLIRGFLTHNLGENTEHILPSIQAPSVTADPNIREVWILSSLRLDLLNVIVRLQQTNKPLACINFIKSRLTVEAFSNLSQDIDLVSQEILIRDTREGSASYGPNVFTNILRPIRTSKQNNLVQVEVHSRKRHNHSKFTILLNNMRLMAVMDWWELACNFILQDSDDQLPSSPLRQHSAEEKKAEIPFELKLNITDSEIVVVEDSSVLDTNAVILKSTTVVTYRSALVEKPLSCNLNNCEVYSCILGMEDETALSIIDPVTINIEINKDRILDITLHTLTVRVSYNDARMFTKILKSLPKQLFFRDNAEIQSSIVQHRIDKLVALGFATEDCIFALDQCGHKLDDAALWLTQHASPAKGKELKEKLSAIEIKSNNIFICIIDDCDDVDVPLLEFSLSKVFFRQGIQTIFNCDENPYKGALECIVSSDYYNRVLSGWEPIVEPWKCLVTWDHTISQNVSKNRLHITIDSNEILNINITSTLTELYNQVKDSWTNDLNKPSNGSLKNDKLDYKRRSPFIPYAIKNDTGSPLYYSTLITEMEDTFDFEDVARRENKWYSVSPGETTTFSFKSRDKIRHSDSHKMRMHQLGVQIKGFQHITPVTVDKVGIYFRHASASIQNRTQKEVPQARIVFDVALEGSARKLVTVRSALQLINKLPENVEIKLESHLPHDVGTLWAPSKTFLLENGDFLSIPLVHAHSIISVRPTDSFQKYTYCSPSISWEQAGHPGDIIHELKTCHSHRGKVYRFCAEIKRENYPLDRAVVLAGYSSQRPQPAHIITLLPTLLLVNLLPVDLSYVVSNENGRVSAGAEAALTFVNTETTLEIKIVLENYPTSNILCIPAGSTNFTYKIRLEDNKGRKLILSAVVTPNSDSKIKITISAPFWIINKTGLPLVFRQGGVSSEAAGQFEEHEVARMVAPFLFSFSDPDASPTVVARVGTNVIPSGNAQWCQNFHLQRGIQVKRLKVTHRDGRPDIVFIVGIEIRQGRGKYRQSNIVTISPRFQLHNKSSYKLLFAQYCYANDINDPTSTYLKAMPDCFIPFHWPRLDQEQLLCVNIQNIPDCCWSGGLRIDSNYSMHVNVRDANSRMYFLRLEVVLQGATYFIVFTDADTMPPPMRIDNFSEVSVKFAQTCCKDYLHSVARAHSSVPYAWDQPTKALYLTVEAPGGVSHTYDISKLDVPQPTLTYENFIYIAFTGTFKRDRGVVDPLDVKAQELVLDVENNRVILSRKEQGRRSQLWRMTSIGQLQHEGSSPPLHPGQIRTENILVLDIEGPAPQPSFYTRLTLRRPDPRRMSTQTWRFTEEGRLCCAHHNMCVQAQDGFFGLRSGNSAVLGLPRPDCHYKTESGIPLEQAVSRQRLRHGSGFLSVHVSTDGPTRVLNIIDMHEKRKENVFAAPDERDWSSIAIRQRPHFEKNEELEVMAKELQFTLRLQALGVSLVSRKPAQELLYAQFSNIVSEILTTSKTKRLCVSVGNIQMDNQLFEAPIPIFVYVTPPSGRGAEEEDKLPALEIRIEMQPILNDNAIIFDHLIVRLKKLTIHLEERLLLKLFEFVSYNTYDEELCNADENDYETQRMLKEVAAHATRYYFGIIQLEPGQIRLSMKTATKLPASLRLIKRKLGLTLIKFEDAGVDLEPYIRKHPFETIQFLMHSIVKHFKDELMWQAGIILGSVDFLGNPIGFMNDVSEGVSGLINEGNVGALVKNVTHGISNSAAKVTESLSDGLGRVAFDDEHEETRQRIRQQIVTGRSKDHLVAGMKGFAFGILGGATSLVKQVYQGASNEGIQGVFSGIGKGLVGTVAKPVVGVLDLASETARAVRDSSRSSSRIMPDRSRPPRCVIGSGGLLPRYSLKQSIGQQFLYNVNDRNYNEQLVAYEHLRSGSEDLRIIISNLKVRIVTSANAPSLTSVIESNLSDLEKCRIIQEPEGGEIRHYIELTVHVTRASATLVYQDPVKKPKVRCDSQEVAKAVTRQINYAKKLFDERKHTLSNDHIAQSED